MLGRSPAPPHNWSTLAKGAVAISALGLLAYTIWTVSSSFVIYLDERFSSLALVTIYGFATILAFYVALSKTYDARVRRAWLFFGLATMTDIIAEILYFYFESILKVSPFPSLADLFYLLYYPLTLAGLLSFPFAPIKGSERRTLSLDLAIIMTTCTMVFWYFILAARSTAASEGWEGILGIAYPIGDMLLLGGVVALLQRDIERVAHNVLIMLAGALVWTAIADSLFAFFEIQEGAYNIASQNILWIASALFQLWAVSFQVRRVEPVKEDETSYFHRSQHLLRLALPYLAVGVGIGLLILAINQGGAPNLRLRGLLNATLFLFGLVLLRQYLILRDNMKLYEDMRRLASTDSLTETYNRHFFNEIFPAELERARRYGKPLSIILADIDGFKKINDKMGHLQGDQVLKKVAGLLTSQLRSTDIIARFGGDEFIIILPEATKDSAKIVASRLRNAVTDHRMQGVQLGVSIGLASYVPGATPLQLLEQADQDLYSQKPALQPDPLSGGESLPSQQIV